MEARFVRKTDQIRGALIKRLGSALNLNIRFPIIALLGGVYVERPDGTLLFY